jgi:hypothetical protein
LFDLLGDDEARRKMSLQTPDWWNRSEEPDAAGATKRRAATASPATQPSSAASAIEPSGIPETSIPETPIPETPIQETPSPEAGRKVPFMELDGERIRVSFTSLTAALAVFAAVVLLLGAFELGRHNGDRAGFARGNAVSRASLGAEALSEIEAARREAPNLRVVDALLTERAAPTPDDPVERLEASHTPTPRWVRDHTYIVAQEFSGGHGDDAVRAQAFLERYGVATELIQYPSGAIQLITAQGYNRTDETQRQMADRFLEKVRAVGVEYFAQGGGYKLEGYFKTLKGDSW